MQAHFPSTDELTVRQQETLAADGLAFLRGQAGTGKTTALLYRLLRLLEQGESPYAILVLVAEASDRHRIADFLRAQGLEALPDLRLTTFTYLARDMVQQFWPLVARPAGFERPSHPPTYIHYDMAQLLMWRIVREMMDGGAFADLLMRPQRIVSQILDTLNRAALNRLSLQEAEQRQIQSWGGDPADARHLRQAGEAARVFREHCRQNNLLDVSLAVRVFDTQLLQHPEFHRYFGERFRHLLVDNLEEQTAAGQQFVGSLLDALQTASLVYDEGGGYKQLLSADPSGARRLEARCEQTFLFTQQFVSSAPMVHLANALERHLLARGSQGDVSDAGEVHLATEAVLDVARGRYRHEMAQNAVQRLAAYLAQYNVSPDEAAIISPGLDGTLRFTLSAALRNYELPFSLRRRRSSPRDEPLVRAWLTWLALAHPSWQRPPPPYDVAEALALSIKGLDPARAELLASALYDPAQGALMPVDTLSPEWVERAGAQQVAAVETLRLWLEAHEPLALGDFLQQLQELLQTRADFEAHEDQGAPALAHWMVDLAARLQQSAAAMNLETAGERGRALLAAVDEGLVSTDPPETGEPPETGGVVVTTIHGYLLSQEVSRIQVWFDVSNPAWWDLPRQPLSNPFVLAPEWTPDRTWTLADAYQRRNEMLNHVIRGLAVRSREGVIVAASTLNQRGQRQDSPLWRALVAAGCIPAPTP